MKILFFFLQLILSPLVLLLLISSLWNWKIRVCSNKVWVWRPNFIFAPPHHPIHSPWKHPKSLSQPKSWTMNTYRNYSKHTNINTYCTPRKHKKYSFFYWQIVSSLGFLADQTHNLFFFLPLLLNHSTNLISLQKNENEKNWKPPLYRHEHIHGYFS